MTASPRLHALLLMLAGLLLLRLLVPWQQNNAEVVVVQALEQQRREASAGLAPEAGASAPPVDLRGAPILDARMSAEPEVLRDPFAVRRPPEAPRQLAPAASPRPAAPAPPAVPPLLVVAEAMPPFQLIGTWLDAQGDSVFAAQGPGVVQVRPGEPVFAAFRLLRIEGSHAVFTETGSGRELRMPLPSAVALQR